MYLGVPIQHWDIGYWILLQLYLVNFNLFSVWYFRVRFIVPTFGDFNLTYSGACNCECEQGTVSTPKIEAGIICLYKLTLLPGRACSEIDCTNASKPELHLVSSPGPTLSWRKTVLWTKSNFLYIRSNVQNVLHQTHSKKGTDTWIEFTIAAVREVLRNNQQSCNLIGPYHFWGISPRNLTLFTRPFLTRRCKQD